MTTRERAAFAYVHNIQNKKLRTDAQTHCDSCKTSHKYARARNICFFVSLLSCTTTKTRQHSSSHRYSSLARLTTVHMTEGSAALGDSEYALQIYNNIEEHTSSHEATRTSKTSHNTAPVVVVQPHARSVRPVTDRTSRRMTTVLCAQNITSAVRVRSSGLGLGARTISTTNGERGGGGKL